MVTDYKYADYLAEDFNFELTDLDLQLLRLVKVLSGRGVTGLGEGAVELQEGA